MLLRLLPLALVYGSALFALALPSSTGAAEPAGGEPVVLKDSGFEGARRTYNPNPEKKGHIAGELSEGWSDNSDWADVQVKYGADESQPHSGKTSQSVEVTKVASGAVQMVQEVPFKKGVYSFSVWLRGQPGTSITLQLRQVSAPSTAYAIQNVTLSAEWREFSVSGTVTDDTQGFLMLIVNSPTSFSVDDARLVNLTNATTNAPPKKGNLITGGSFEAGVSASWSVGYSGDTKNRFADVRPTVDAREATEGRQSLRLEVPPGDQLTVYSPLLHYNANRAHTVSLDLKASEPNTGVRMEMEGTQLGIVADLGTQWKRFTFSGVLPYRPYGRFKLIYTLHPSAGPRTIWMDAVQLEEAEEATPYIAPFPCELTLRVPRPGSVVFTGERQEVLVSVGPQPPRGAKLKLSATDLAGQSRPVATVALPAESFPLPDFAKSPLGMFKLHGEIVDKAGTPLSAPVEMVWARLPRPRPLAPEKSFFGVHIPLAPAYIATAAATGHRWARLHDSSMIGKWAIVEPKQGEFNFYDEGVTAAHEAGLAILGTLDGAPAWASAKPRATGGYWSIWNIPDGTAHWEKYVRTVAEHYKGRIDAWEVWNEPWGQWWTGAGGTPEAYGALLKVAFKTVKEVNPAGQVLGIDTYRGHDWTEKALEASGTESFDGFSFHNYDAAAFGGAENPAATDARTYREAQARHGTPKPMWITEGGPGGIGSFYAPETGGIEPAQQGAQAVRFDVAQMANGIQAFFLYAVHADPPMGDAGYNAIEHDRAIKPILAARAVLASLVDGAKCEGRSEPVQGVDQYDFQPRDGQKISVFWSYDGSARELPRPKAATVLDLQGNVLAGKTIPVGPQPVYLVR